MGELKWLDKYSGESLEELVAWEGKYRVDSLVLAFEQGVREKVARVGADKLSEEERVILAVEALEREVNNGGYDQFFVNTAEFVPLVVDALNRVGCPEVAALTQEAIDILGMEGRVTVEVIEQLMEEESDERDDRLNKCDRRYYKEAGDLAGKLFEFIKRNNDKIKLNE